MSHSFVRGIWRNQKTALPIILAKSCHDLDLLRWIVDKPCRSVSAMGGLSFFRNVAPLSARGRVPTARRRSSIFTTNQGTSYGCIRALR